MEHSVCKVSAAHQTKEWLSTLFEALDGLQLSVNNYLLSLLWIACRNKCHSPRLHQRSCPNSLHILTWKGTRKGDPVWEDLFVGLHAFYIVSRVAEAGLCLVKIRELTCLLSSFLNWNELVLYLWSPWQEEKSSPCSAPTINPFLDTLLVDSALPARIIPLPSPPQSPDHSSKWQLNRSLNLEIWADWSYRWSAI